MKIIIDDDGVMHKVFTKADIIAMLTEIQKEIKELNTYDIERTHGLIEDGYVTTDVSDIIQNKINALEEQKDETDNRRNN